MMVRLIGLSSSSPILMKGKANAQKMIGRRIINGKYFCANGSLVFFGAAIGLGRTKETCYLKSFGLIHAGTYQCSW
jgi:hypothetical protein